MYKLADVRKDYPKGRSVVHALAGVDAVIEDAEWLAIQGPTGHGKSTLLQVLGGLDRPTSGLVELDGQNLADLRESEVTRVRATSIGFIFQTFNLIPTLSAQENVEVALVPLGVGPAERRARSAAALESVGLGERARHLPSELSGGSSSAWRSRGRWSRSPRWCSPTSRPATSTRGPGTTSWRCWRSSGASEASR